MLDTQPQLTTGVMTELLGEKLHRVKYVIEKLNLEPTSRVAGVRVFSNEAFIAIATELEAIAAKRSKAVTR